MAGTPMASVLPLPIALLLKNSNSRILEDLTWDEFAKQVGDTTLTGYNPFKCLLESLRRAGEGSEDYRQSVIHCHAYLDSAEKIGLVQELLRQYNNEADGYATKACIFVHLHWLGRLQATLSKEKLRLSFCQICCDLCKASSTIQAKRLEFTGT